MPSPAHTSGGSTAALRRGTVVRIERDSAVIRLEDGRELSWSLSNLPADVEQGTNVDLTLTKTGAVPEATAKAMLNELLGNERSKNHATEE